MDDWTHVQHMFSTVRQQIARRQTEQQQHRQEIEQLRAQQQQRDTGALRALPPKRISSGRLQESISKVDQLARQAEQQPTENHYDLWRQQEWLKSKRRLQQQILRNDPEGWLQHRMAYLLATSAPPPVEERQTERIPTVRRTQPLRPRNHQSA